MNPNIDQITQEILAGADALASSKDVYEFRKLFLDGKTGKIGLLMREMKNIAPEARAAYGKGVNELKEWALEFLSSLDEKMKAKELQDRYEAEKIDISLPAETVAEGNLHPITLVKNQIIDIFAGMGFEIFEGTEIETDYYNFTALNAPADHPSRSMQDTFYVDRCDEEGRQLPLRPHTSPMQVRYARTHAAPIKIIAPGRTYRVDSDATHSPMFHQVEGLWIGDDVSFTDLKGVYSDFLRRFFETDDLVVRFRPSYFPFTEPSVEVDMMFTSGPRKGKWLEISGAGEVHPNVVRNYGLDPEKNIGFAFGSGLERLTMLRYGIDDLRLFFEGDLRFLRQFN